MSGPYSGHRLHCTLGPRIKPCKWSVTHVHWLCSVSRIINGQTRFTAQEQSTEVCVLEYAMHDTAHDTHLIFIANYVKQLHEQLQGGLALIVYTACTYLYAST